MNRIDQERMPATIAFAVFFSGLFVLAWAIAGLCLIWLATAFASPANTGTTIFWTAVIVLGVATNVAIIVGTLRRQNWARWLGVLQSLVLIVVCALSGPVVAWGALVLAIHSILFVVPSSNAWFRYRRAQRVPGAVV